MRSMFRPGGYADANLFSRLNKRLILPLRQTKTRMR